MAGHMTERFLDYLWCKNRCIELGCNKPDEPCKISIQEFNAKWTEPWTQIYQRRVERSKRVR